MRMTMQVTELNIRLRFSLHKHIMIGTRWVVKYFLSTLTVRINILENLHLWLCFKVLMTVYEVTIFTNTGDDHHDIEETLNSRIQNKTKEKSTLNIVTHSKLPVIEVKKCVKTTPLFRNGDYDQFIKKY